MVSLAYVHLGHCGIKDLIYRRNNPERSQLIQDPFNSVSSAAAVRVSPIP